MILVDTSIWIDHLHHRDAKLVEMLEEVQVACHPFILGELACGFIPDRDEVLSLLQSLPMLEKASDAEALAFIAEHQLDGLGLIDVHLLASARLARAKLWSRDKAIRRVAVRLDVAAGLR